MHCKDSGGTLEDVLCIGGEDVMRALGDTLKCIGDNQCNGGI